jgi:beta-galactosidase
MLDAYRALRRRGLSIDMVPSDTEDLSGYDLVLAPGLACIPDGLQRAASQAVSLYGPRAGAVTEELTIPVPMGPALDGLDTTVTRVESLPPGTERPAAGGGVVRHWFETLEGTADTLIQTTDDSPVLVASDTTHYLGGWPDDMLWDRIVVMLADKAGIDVLDLPPGVRVRDTGTHRFYFNYGPEAVEVEGNTLAPAGVRWAPRSD